MVWWLSIKGRHTATKRRVDYQMHALHIESYVSELPLQPLERKLRIKDSSKLKKCDNEDILIGRYVTLEKVSLQCAIKCILDHDVTLLMWLQSSHLPELDPKLRWATQAGFNKNDRHPLPTGGAEPFGHIQKSCIEDRPRRKLNHLPQLPRS